MARNRVLMLLAGLTALTTASPSFADTYLDGQLIAEPRIFYNADFLKGNANTDLAHILPRLWLGVGYKGEDYAEAYFRLHTLGASASLGQSSYGGTQPGGTSENRHTPSFTQAWFDVKIPGTPVHWRVGRFAQSLGHGFYLNTGPFGGDGMKLWAPIGRARVDLGYMKMGDLGDFSRDIDQYFLQASSPIADGHQISAAWQWFDGRNLNINANHSSREGFISHIFTVWDPLVTFDSQIWSIGLAADGLVPMGGFSLSYRAEAVYAGGQLSADFDKVHLEGTTQKPENLSGFALLGGVTANFNGMATVTLEGAYGSGDEKKKIDAANFGSGTRYEGFKIPMAQWGRSVWLNELSFVPNIFTGDPFDFGAGSGRGQNGEGARTAYWVQRGLENLIYLTAGATYSPITPITLSLDIFKFWVAETTPRGGFDPDSQIIYHKRQSSDLGWEIDLTAKWVFNKNFSVSGSFAPWIPGRYFQVPKNSRFVPNPAVYDPHDPTSFSEVEETSDPRWGYMLRSYCVFTF